MTVSTVLEFGSVNSEINTSFVELSHVLYYCARAWFWLLVVINVCLHTCPGPTIIGGPFVKGNRRPRRFSGGGREEEEAFRNWGKGGPVAMTPASSGMTTLTIHFNKENGTYSVPLFFDWRTSWAPRQAHNVFVRSKMWENVV